MTAMPGRIGLQVIWVTCLVSALIYSGVRFTTGEALQTDLTALLPPTEVNPLAEHALSTLSQAAGNRTVFLIGHAEGSRAKSLAEAFAGSLRDSGAFKTVQAQLPAVDPETASRLYRPHRFYLLAHEDRAQLGNGTFQPRQRFRERLYQPFGFSTAMSVAEDPFGLFERFLADLPLFSTRLTLDDRWLVAHDKDRIWVLVTADLSGSAYGHDIQRRVIDSVRSAESSLRSSAPEAALLRAGTVFHAANARETAEHEAGFIFAGSVAGVVILMWLVFRSFGPLLLGLSSVLAGVAAATAVTLLVFGELHLLTLVFGASLIGEAIDYSIQYFVTRLDDGTHWDPVASRRRVLPALNIALATSALGYAILAAVPFPGLRQISCFALTGLLAAFLTVVLVLPTLKLDPIAHVEARRLTLPAHALRWWTTRVTAWHAFAIVAAIVLLAIGGWMRLKPSDDIRLLIHREPSLTAQEEQIRHLTGIGGGSQFFLVEGGDVETLLVNEEQLTARLRPLIESRDITGFLAVSRFVPSAGRQADDRRLIDKAVFSDPSALRRMLAAEGLRDAPIDAYLRAHADERAKPLRPEAWIDAPHSARWRHLWLGQTESGFASLVVPQGHTRTGALAQAASGLVGVTFVDKPASVTRLFRDYRAWGGAWLVMTALLIYLVLRVRYGWGNGLIILIPTLLAMGAALAVIGYLGFPLTFFNVMGLVLVLGVGINYCVFLYESGTHAPATLVGVLVSAATTVLAFGLLAFTTMPALKHFGLTLLCGIGTTVLLAPLVLTLRRPA